MNYLLIAAGVLLVILAYGYFLKIRAHQKRADELVELDTVTGWKPRGTRLMKSAEKQAFDTLRRALPACLVLSQVPLSRFIKVDARNSYSEWLRRVGNQCADLVVCNDQSKVLAVVEVRDAKAYLSPRAVQRNERKAKSLKAAGIALHLWQVDALPSDEQVRAILSGVPAAASYSSPSVAVIPESRMRGITVEFNDAPPSTWFDEVDSSPAALQESESVRQKLS